MSKKRALVALAYLGIVVLAVIVLSFDVLGTAQAHEWQIVAENVSVYLPLVMNAESTPTPTPTPAPTPPGPTPTLPPVGDAIIIDHTSVDLFDQIPDEYLSLARNTRMLFSDRSVGDNIDNYLDCLAGSTDWEDTPAYCRKDYYDTSTSLWLSMVYPNPDYPTPARILFDPDPVKYNRDNWFFVYKTGDWEALTENFVTDIVPCYVNPSQTTCEDKGLVRPDAPYDVLSYQFSYLNINFDSSIDDADDGYFVDLPSNYYPNYPSRVRWDISDIEALEVQYPNKVFIFWTTSLARGIGTLDGQNFNQQMRQYAIENDKILFDVADIESHDPLGHACYDNRDGVEYCNAVGNCENHPDDGQNIVAICQDYTSELDGGHLGAVSSGGIRIAKAFWVLMARLSGWNP